MSCKADDLLNAWSSLFVAHGLAVRHIEAGLAGSAPLTLDEYDILLCVTRSQGSRIRLSDLASRTVFTRSGITRVVTRLTKSGFLTRTRCKEDLRGAYAEITPKGRDAMKLTWKHYSKEILSILEPALSQAEAQNLGEYLEKVIDKLQGVSLVQIRRAG